MQKNVVRIGTIVALFVVMVIALLPATEGAAQDEAPQEATCRGRVVTVDIAAGDRPTRGNDVILGTPGDDVIEALAGNDVVCGGGGSDEILGGRGRDILFGDRGNDKLFGGKGRDLLKGGPGKDVLRGGRGGDVYNGGRGEDTCGDAPGTTKKVKGCDVGTLMPGVDQPVVTMARANWSSGYIQAQIIHGLIEELGYELSEPSDLELSPDIAYNRMAEGRIDFWTNSWYPGHLVWWELDRADGQRVGDFLEIAGTVVESVEGVMIDKLTATELGVTSFEDLAELIAADSSVAERFDRNGNGVADIYGCPEDWTCDDIIDHFLDEKGWLADGTFEQIKAGYDAMFAEALDLVNAGDSVLFHTWAPSTYFTELTSGDNMLWLGFEEPPSPFSEFNNTDPAGADATRCPQQPCHTGFGQVLIRSTANSEFLADQPAIAKFLAEVSFPIGDLSRLQAAQANLDGRQGHVDQLAAEWIAQNRDVVNQWLRAAR